MKAKKRCYQYSEEGEFLRIWDSQSEVSKVYFDIETWPLFARNNYYKLPDNTFIANYRIGREGLRKRERIANCPYCTYRNNHVDIPVEVFNLLGEKIAEFKNPRTAALMLNVDINAINRKLKESKRNKANNDNLKFKFKQ